MRNCRQRAPINLTNGCRLRDSHLDTAAWMIDRSGLAPPLQAVMTKSTGRPRTLANVRGMLIVLAANGLTRHHTAHNARIGRVIDALSPEERFELGFLAWDSRTGYLQVNRFIDALNDTLTDAPLVTIHDDPVVLDHQEFLTRLLEASQPEDLPTSKSIAVDGTAMESWGALYGDPTTIEDTGPAHLSKTTGKRRSPSGKAKIHGHGPDGRAIHTADRDARGGYRSATNSRKAGAYIGYELHLAVQARDVKATNYIDEVRLGEEVPNLILAARLAPAGTHRGEAVVPILKRLRRTRPATRDLLVDQGYSYAVPGKFAAPLRSVGYRPVFELHPNQRGQYPLDADAHLLDGGLFSPHLPDHHLGEVHFDGRRSLPMPPLGATAEQVKEYQKPFNDRARYRYSVHAGPDDDGYRRLRCPFCAGRGKARAFPKTMRLGPTVPILPVAGGPERCCKGIITVSAEDLALWQDIPFGTTAWFMSYRRRNCVESVNAALKGQFVDIDKGYQSFLRADKITLMLAFTLAGVNIDRANAYRAKHALKPAAYCRKRRTATLDDIIRQG